MDLQTFYTTIQAAISGDSKTLSITNAVMGAGAYATLAEQYGLTSIGCQDAVLSEIAGEQFTLTGSNPVIAVGQNNLPGLDAFTCNFIFTIKDGEPQFSMSIDLSTNADWKLTTTFVDLDNTFIAAQETTWSALNFSTRSQDLQTDIYFNAGMSLVGVYTFNGPMSTFLAPLLPQGGVLNTGAYISAISPTTTIDLLTAPVSTLSVKSISLTDWQFKLVESTPPSVDQEPPADYSPLSMEMLFKMNAGNSIVVDVVGQYPMLSKTITLDGTLETPISLSQGLSDLANLIGVSDVTGVLPAPLKEIGDTIAIKSAGVAFPLDSLTDISSSTVTLAITKSFDLFPSLSILKVKELDFSWQVFNPFASEPMIYFSSFSTVKIGDTYDVDLQIVDTGNGYSLSAVSSPDDELELNSVLTHFGVPEGLFPTLGISQFQFSGNFTTSNYFFALMTEENWKIGSSDISLSNVYLHCEYDGSNFTGGAAADFVIPNTDTTFQISGEKSTGWTFRGQLTSDMITVTKLMQQLTAAFGFAINDFPGLFNDISIMELGVTIGTDPEAFTFHILGDVEILGTSVQIQLDVDISKHAGNYFYDTGGSILIGGQIFTLHAKHEQSQNSIAASWTAAEDTSLEINNILQEFDLSAIDVPSEVNLSLAMKKVVFTYESGATNEITMQLTNTKDMTAYFGTKTIESERKYFMAVALGDGYSSSSLSSKLSFLDGITFHQFYVAISDFTDTSFVIPNSPYTGIVAGFDFRTQMTMSSSDTSSGLGKAVNFMGGSFGSTFVDVAVNLSQSEFELKGTLEGVSLPFVDETNKYFTMNNFNVNLKSTPLSISLGCVMSLNTSFGSPITQPPINIAGSLGFILNAEGAAIQASFYEETKIEQPFGISILTLDNIGFDIAGEAGPVTGIDITVIGQFELGDPSSDKKISEKFGASIEFVDDIINIPYFESDTQGPITIPAIWDACFPALPAPSILGAIEIDELDFYFCDQQIMLPNRTVVNPGTSFLAAFSIWNFSTFCNLIIGTGGVSGKLEMDPLVLAIDGTTVMTLKGNGLGDVKYNIQRGGAEIDFNTSDESFNATIRATFLSLEEDLEANISSSGFAFDMEAHGLLDAKLKCSLRKDTDFAASFFYGPNFSVSLGSLLGFSLGSVTINDQIGASTSLSVKPGEIDFYCSGTVILEGDKFIFGPFNIDVTLSSIEALLSAIEKEIVDEAEHIFADIITDPTKWAGLAKNGIITGVQDMNAVLQKGFELEAKAFAAVLNAIGISPNDISKALKDLFGIDAPSIAGILTSLTIPTGAIGAALHAAGFGANEIANGLYSVSDDIGDIAKQLSALGFGGQVIGVAFQGLDLSVDELATALKGIGWTADQVASVLKGFGATLKDIATTITNVFTDITPEALSNVLQGLGYAVSDIAGVFEDIGGALADFASDAWDTTKKVLDPTEW